MATLLAQGLDLIVDGCVAKFRGAGATGCSAQLPQGQLGFGEAEGLQRFLEGAAIHRNHQGHGLTVVGEKQFTLGCQLLLCRMLITSMEWM
ncbi:hypothetical protein KQ306_06725 [Synechococcus sp. CS-1324]|nr:hypothetical protein [Synechococcus sp. CS-1324]